MKVSREEYERLDFEDFAEKLKPQYSTLCSLEDMKNACVQAVNVMEVSLAIHILEPIEEYGVWYYDYDREKGMQYVPQPLSQKEDLVKAGYLELVG